MRQSPRFVTSRIYAFCPTLLSQHFRADKIIHLKEFRPMLCKLSTCQCYENFVSPEKIWMSFIHTKKKLGLTWHKLIEDKTLRTREFIKKVQFIFI